MTSMKLKNPKGWFAAGAEVQKALTTLSDGAFKLFVYLCLHARRDRATVETTQTELAQRLGKSQGAIRKQLRELVAQGICRTRFSHSRFRGGVIEIDRGYWPYERDADEAVSTEEAAYVSAIQKLLEARACVRQSSLAVADELMAREWFQKGIPLERVDQAILLGCVRKYTSWRNGQSRTRVGSLKYFQPLLEELANTKTSPDYWHYARSRLDRLERLWLQNTGTPSTDNETQETASAGQESKTRQNSGVS
jgi:hypothetical protein